MHVEISVALNFVISYLYNKLPRRRVDLFGEELEVGLKAKFRGHWYPERPNKGSGYRCIKANGDEVDPVLCEAVVKAGLDLPEVKSYLPDDLTMWIDPSEVSYKIGERGPVKVLYCDKKEDESGDNVDSEVQAANRTFNPEAQTFTPEGHTQAAQSQQQQQQSHHQHQQQQQQQQIPFTPDVLAFTADVAAFCNGGELSSSSQSSSFQPIDSLSSSLSNLSLSPSSPVPPTSWSTTTSPSSALFTSALPAQSPGPATFLGPRVSNQASRQQFTAATFAQTKFGSTKLKTQVKRPNRLSPTEFGNFFRQQQRTTPPTYTGPPRPRSLSPRDPRVEFLIDQQQRMMFHQQQQQQQQQQQISPSMPYGKQYINHPLHHQHHQQQHHQQQHHQQQQQLSPTGMYPEFLRQHSSSSHSSPHLSPHLSPQGNPSPFPDMFQPPVQSPSRPTSLSHMGRHPGHMSGTLNHQGPANSSSALSPDASNKSFVDGLGVAPVNYSNSLQHLLMAN